MGVKYLKLSAWRVMNAQSRLAFIPHEDAVLVPRIKYSPTLWNFLFNDREKTHMIIQCCDKPYSREQMGQSVRSTLGMEKLYLIWKG